MGTRLHRGYNRRFSRFPWADMESARIRLQRSFRHKRGRLCNVYHRRCNRSLVLERAARTQHPLYWSLRSDTIGPKLSGEQFWGNVYGADHTISQQTRANWMATPGAWSGSLGLNGEFLLGFRLPTPSGYQYGWISIGMTGPDPAVDTPILTGWAYQTQPGLSITAGAVPEPGTLALAGIGIAVWLSLKRRNPACK